VKVRSSHPTTEIEGRVCPALPSLLGYYTLIHHEWPVLGNSPSAFAHAENGSDPPSLQIYRIAAIDTKGSEPSSGARKIGSL
ncbi:MAG: hypothetical protein ACU0DI_10545, partial [Paracoccaceae bacterium]